MDLYENPLIKLLIPNARWKHNSSRFELNEREIMKRNLVAHLVPRLQYHQYLSPHPDQLLYQVMGHCQISLPHVLALPREVTVYVVNLSPEARRGHKERDYRQLHFQKSSLGDLTVIVDLPENVLDRASATVSAQWLQRMS